MQKALEIREPLFCIDYQVCPTLENALLNVHPVSTMKKTMEGKRPIPSFYFKAYALKSWKLKWIGDHGYSM